MSHDQIPDFTESEIWVVRSALYDEIGECVVSALQVEADHLRAQKIKTDASPENNDDDASDKPDTRPIFWGD